jgi:hypothetical protein
VPKELTVDNLPWSFRFYDPILLITQDIIEDEIKDMNQFINMYRLRHNSVDDFWKKFANQIFGISDESKKEKLNMK